MVMPEAYLESSRTYTMELFCENSSRFLAVNYFRKNAPLQIFHWVLNMPLNAVGNAKGNLYNSKNTVSKQLSTINDWSLYLINKYDAEDDELKSEHVMNQLEEFLVD